MDNGPPPQALIVTTTRDWVTQFIASAGDEIDDLLRTNNWATCFLTGGRAVRTTVVDELANSAPPIELGYFSAHGTEPSATAPGLAEYASSTAPLVLDPTLAANHLQGAILALSSCLFRGSFPDAIVTASSGVRTVIGYRHHLVVGPETLMDTHFGDHPEVFQGMFTNALVQPVRSLVAGSTVEEAVEATRELWEAIHTDTTLHDDIRAIWGLNKLRICFWGDGTARLC